MPCSRVFSCAFSAQAPLCALQPIMGLRGGAGQRGADLCPPGTSAHHGHHLLRAGGHVRGKGARCVRVPCLLMHQHAVMCALSCSPLPAPALPILLGVCNMCMSMCVSGCMSVCMRVYACVRMCYCVFLYPLASPPLALSPLPFYPLSCFLLASASFPLACFLSPPRALPVPYYLLPIHSLPFSSLPSSPLPSPRFAAHRLSLPSPLPSPPCCGDKCQICTFADIRAHVINLLLQVQSSSSYHHCYTLISTRTHARTDSTHAHTHTHLCPDPRMCTGERAHTHLHAHGRDACSFVRRTPALTPTRATEKDFFFIFMMITWEK